jgi:Fe-S-cluster containining protein
MKRSVTAKDISTFAKLDMVYNQIRVIESRQNETKYKCLGSGKCCHIGLVIPMTECANIAFKLNQEYYLVMENKGKEEADKWIAGIIEALTDAMYDETWQHGGESKRLCAFYKNGCSIYGYRPMVCRTFGTITSVDDYCPRIRNANGEIDHFSGDPVKKIIRSYQDLLAEYAHDKHENYDMTVYMPLGVLSFLLETEELEKLAKDTDPKFWVGTSGWFNYRVQYTKMHGYSLVELKKSAGAAGKELAFDTEE